MSVYRWPNFKNIKISFDSASEKFRFDPLSGDCNLRKAQTEFKSYVFARRDFFDSLYPEFLHSALAAADVWSAPKKTELVEAHIVRLHLSPSVKPIPTEGTHFEMTLINRDIPTFDLLKLDKSGNLRSMMKVKDIVLHAISLEEGNDPFSVEYLRVLGRVLRYIDALANTSTDWSKMHPSVRLSKDGVTLNTSEYEEVYLFVRQCAAFGPPKIV